MNKRQTRRATWIEVAVRNAGMRRGTTAMVWAYQWAVTREDLGHEPTVDEVAQWWALNRRKAFREQAAFREAFPMLETPAQIDASPEVRQTLRETIDGIENLTDLRKGLSMDLGALRLGGLPAHL